jgi:hypothetical protein
LNHCFWCPTSYSHKSNHAEQKKSFHNKEWFNF